MDVGVSSQESRHPHPIDPANYVYEACAAEVLPSIDCAKTLKAAWLRPSTLKHCNAFFHRFHILFSSLYIFSLPISVTASFVKAKTGAQISIVTLILHTPALTSAILALRYDMVRLILTTYDFWFFTILNIMQAILLSIFFHDFRVFSVIASFLGYFVVIMGDANFRAVRVYLVATMFVIILDVALVGALMVDFIDQSYPFDLLETGSRTVSVQDILGNILATLAVFLLRNIYRRYSVLKTTKPQDSTVQCLNYHCSIRLRPHIRTPSLDNIGHPQIPSVTQLTFLRFKETFDARDVLVSQTVISFDPWSSQTRAMIYGCGVCGFASTVASVTEWRPSSSDKHQATRVFLLCSASIICTTLFVGIFICHCQRKLLRHLALSFDLVYFSSQITLAVVCMMEFLSWNTHCLAIAATWMWIHWVLTLDALTPVIKRKLGFKTQWSIIVVATFIAAEIAFATAIALLHREHWRDRVIASAVIRGQRVEIRLISFCCSRLFSVMCLTVRLLWRLVHHKEDGLFMIVGTVTFQDYKHKPVRPISERLRRQSMRLAQKFTNSARQSTTTRVKPLN